MIKHHLILFTLLLALTSLKAQVFWTETFDSSPCAAGSGCDPSIVGWTQLAVGAEGTAPNEWYVSDTESGMAAGQCGAANQNDQSLHVGNVSTSAAAGLFCPTGDCGAAYDDSGPAEMTNRRAESPVINCTGQTNITVDFNYIEEGEASDDDASFWYFDGATWSNLDPIAKSNNGACAPQGQWTAVTTIALPPSADNNPNVRIGFLWVNDGDGSASDPSFAVDDITLTNNGPVTGPTASFSSSDSTLCAGDCISFTDLSTGSPTGWTWYFPGSATATSSVQNPTNICYNTAGSYDVSLVADNGSNTDSLYIPNFITVNPLPTITANASPSTTVCSGTMVTLTGSGGTSYSWDNGVTDGVPFAAASTTTYTVTGTDANGCENTDMVTITVNNCSQPTASFTADSITICAGGDILFTDNSTGTGITAWNWTFNGGTPPTANTQGPHNVTFNTPGVYNITLQITDANGTDDTTIVVTVNNCNTVTAGITPSSTNICVGDSVVFNDASSGANTWSWNFDQTGVGGATPSTANTQGPHTVFFNTAGTYTVELTAGDGTSTDVTSVTITVSTCTVPVAGISMDDVDGEICENGCIDFTYGGSGGIPTTIDWIFEGGTPSTYNSTDPNEVITVCWNDTTGTFNVDVTASNTNGTDNASSVVVVHVPPIVDAGADTNIIIGQNADLSATVTDTAGNPLTGGTFEWNPFENLSCFNCQSTTVVEALNTGEYVVTYTDQYGCVVSDTVLVEVDVALNVGVPSAFSPNGDGSNDLLLVKGTLVIESLRFTIFNRYGQKVYESTDKEQGWDGTHNGTELNPGVFVYYLNVIFIDGSTEELKGNVTLVR